MKTLWINTTINIIYKKIHRSNFHKISCSFLSLVYSFVYIYKKLASTRNRYINVRSCKTWCKWNDWRRNERGKLSISPAKGEFLVSVTEGASFVRVSFRTEGYRKFDKNNRDGRTESEGKLAAGRVRWSIWRRVAQPRVLQ